MESKDALNVLRSYFELKGISLEEVRKYVKETQERRRAYLGVTEDQIVVCANCDEEGIADDLCCIGRYESSPNSPPFDFLCNACVMKQPVPASFLGDVSNANDMLSKDG